MSYEGKPLLLIAGPTAVGKSELALTCALRMAGEIVNLDSVQLYRGLDIGSAKPTLAERALVPHHLFDIFDPTDQGNVGRYLEYAEPVIADIHGRSKLPIVVGGTGMYITSLMQGLADLPTPDPLLRAELDATSTTELREKLLKLDPESADSISMADRMRTIRALETVMLSGKKASSIKASHGHRKDRFRGLIVVPLRSRAELYARINQRTEKMLELGLIDEVQSIISRCGSDAPALDAIGYKEVVSFLRGDIAKETLAELIALDTRRFAKRQLTFWRNEPIKRGWRVRPSGNDERYLVTGIAPTRRSQVKPIEALLWSEDRLLNEIEARLAHPFEGTEVWRYYKGTE